MEQLAKKAMQGDITAMKLLFEQRKEAEKVAPELPPTTFIMKLVTPDGKVISSKKL